MWPLRTAKCIIILHPRGIPGWQDIYKKYPFPFSTIEGFNLRNADTAIAGNEEAKSVLERKGFGKRISVIPQFGVDEQKFRKVDNNLPRKKLCFAGSFNIRYVGRPVREKGISDLVKAAGMCGVGVRLLVIGDGPLRKDLIRTARDLGIGKL